VGPALALGRKAGIEIREVGGLQLVALADARAFLEACEAAGVLVLGVEGFRLDSGQVHPDLGAIADFSQLTDSRESVLEARSFVEAVGQPEMLFDFALSEGSRSVWDLLGAKSGADLAVAFSSLFWPEFVEVEGCVLLRERYSPSQFQDWWKELGGDRSTVEGVVNHVHLWDLFDLDEEAVPDKAIRDLAQVLASTWRCALQHRFPRKAFEVRLILDDPDEYGPTITFSTVPRKLS
jgi:hypothetical protein